MDGLIHIYCGDGKGKTTAAVGLSVRALGAGKQVVFAQFLKDGSSSEINVLKGLNNAHIYFSKTHRGFYKNQNEQDREKTKSEYRELFEDVINHSQNGIQLLVLDEIVAACKLKIIDEERLLHFLKCKPKELEVVMTGRDPSQHLLAFADYITEMKKIKHPYDDGINARYGIEF